ncbi:acetate--CoA ligase alpha subunit [Candidatus Methanomassiliicoccus intestinalis]|uniref:acetate--CoA ligase alpha subunit n=1 Tax=Candidatus Methanomassiliicoccus intestinalis TaxID=1406512 RepID=UPI0037DC19C9
MLGAEELFTPKSIAVIGASADPEKIGHMVLTNLHAAGYAGSIYAVNARGGEALGHHFYKSVLEIAGPVDLAVITIPAAIVPSVMEELGKKGTPAAVIISAGFREMGAEGTKLELEVGAIAKKYGIRLLGPNCLGLLNTANKMNASFTAAYPQEGSIALTSQSGAVCSALLDWAQEYGVGFSKFVSMGNKLDLDEADLLQYLISDEDTAVIGMYIEGMNRGREFMKEAKLTSQQKPIIVLKSGRTNSGAKAASSHTGAMSGSDSVYDAALKQSGIIRAHDLEELTDYLQVFSAMPIPRGRNIAVVTNAGGMGVMAADAVSDYGLTLATLSKPTIELLREKLPRAANIYNPIDVLGDAPAERFKVAINAVLNDPAVDLLMVMLAPTDTIDISAAAKAIAEFKELKIPVVAAMVGGKEVNKGSAILREVNIPVYESPERAVRALGAMAAYLEIKNAPDEDYADEFIVDKLKIQNIIKKASDEGRVSLTESEGKAILQAYEIKTPRKEIATSAEEAVQVANKLGYPVVMKISSADIAHKTDVGGVSLNLRNEEEIRNAYSLMMEKVKAAVPTARLDGVLVEEMFQGRELIVGMVRDKQFGPVITFGLGGIFVEIMKDVSRGIAPLSQQKAEWMIKSIKSYPILAGARGKKPADLAALKNLILKISQLSLNFPEISELEMNPVMAGESGCCAVDALVVIRREKK